MVKRFPRTVLAVGCFVGAIVPGPRVFAQAPSQGAEMLQRLPAAPDPKRTVTMTYRFTRTTSKYKGTEEQLVAKLAAHKAQIEQEAPIRPATDLAIRQLQLHDVQYVFESLLRYGETATCDGQAEIAPGYRAVAEKTADDGNARWFWTIQRGKKVSEYREDDQHADVSEVPLQRESRLSLFMETVGLFGKPSAYMDARIREAKSFKTDDGRITVEIDDNTAVFAETPAHQLVLESFRTNGKRDPITVRFAEYRTFGGVLLPTQITRDVSTHEFDLRSAYRLEDVEIDGELTVPFKAARIEGD